MHLYSLFTFHLTAYGIAAADVVQEEQTPCAAQYTEETRSALVKQLMDLVDTGIARLQEQGFTEDTTYGEKRWHEPFFLGEKRWHDSFFSWEGEALA